MNGLERAGASWYLVACSSAATPRHHKRRLWACGVQCSQKRSPGLHTRALVGFPIYCDPGVLAMHCLDYLVSFCRQSRCKLVCRPWQILLGPLSWPSDFILNWGDLQLQLLFFWFGCFGLEGWIEGPSCSLCLTTTSKALVPFSSLAFCSRR